MNVSETVYDSANAHPLRWMENRPNGMALYQDQVDGTRIVCAVKSVDQYPRQVRAFKPVVRRDDGISIPKHFQMIGRGHRSPGVYKEARQW